MARRTLDRHPKFKRLFRELRINRALARGHLELWWDSAHDKSCPIFESAAELEACAEWEGEPGALAAKLVDVKLADALPKGRLQVHDYWDHCPEYVWKRQHYRLNKTAENSRKRQKMAENLPPDPDTDPKPLPEASKKTIGSGVRGNDRLFTKMPEEQKPSKRGGNPSAAGAIANDLLKGAGLLPTTNGSRATDGSSPYDCYSFDELDVTRFISSFERSSNHSKAVKMWQSRVAEVSKMKGGLHFLRELCDHIQQSVKGNKVKGIGKLDNVAAYCNKETNEFLQRRKAS